MLVCECVIEIMIDVIKKVYMCVFECVRMCVSVVNRSVKLGEESFINGRTESGNAFLRGRKIRSQRMHSAKAN